MRINTVIIMLSRHFLLQSWRTLSRIWQVKKNNSFIPIRTPSFWILSFWIWLYCFQFEHCHFEHHHFKFWFYCQFEHHYFEHRHFEFGYIAVNLRNDFFAFNPSKKSPRKCVIVNRGEKEKNIVVNRGEKEKK